MKPKFVRFVTLCLVILLVLFTSFVTPALARKEADEGNPLPTSGGASVQPLPPRTKQPTPPPRATPTPRPTREPKSPESPERGNSGVADGDAPSGGESPSLPDRHSDV